MLLRAAATTKLPRYTSTKVSGNRERSQLKENIGWIYYDANANCFICNIPKNGEVGFK